MDNRAAKRGQGKSTAATFFIVFFVLAALIVSFFAIDFFGGAKRASMTYTIGAESYTLSAKQAYADNELLVCFDDIAALCEMSETGSVSARTFYAANSEQSIALTENSQVALLNGAKVDMLAAARLYKEKLYVPLSFVEGYMTGIAIARDGDHVTIHRGEYNASTKGNPLFVDTTFAGGEDVPATAPVEPEKTAPTYEFVADLSAYEQYMCPEDPGAFLILVNREKTVDSTYVPDNLVNIRASRSDRTERMVETAEMALQALYIEMRAAGYTDVSVTSGYRTYEKQDYLYRLYTENEMKDHPDWSKERAQKEVDTYSARPGTSEHQTGLCVDMHNLGSASVRFAEKAAYKWLIENCYKFGFILRFPEGKEDITGYSFEPWHYRFVGRLHASEMHRLDMCLEEYLEYLGQE